MHRHLDLSSGGGDGDRNDRTNGVSAQPEGEGEAPSQESARGPLKWEREGGGGLRDFLES